MLAWGNQAQDKAWMAPKAMLQDGNRESIRIQQQRISSCVICTATSKYHLQMKVNIPFSRDWEAHSQQWWAGRICKWCTLKIHRSRQPGCGSANHLLLRFRWEQGRRLLEVLTITLPKWAATWGLLQGSLTMHLYTRSIPPTPSAKCLGSFKSRNLFVLLCTIPTTSRSHLGAHLKRDSTS